uniref:Thioredoxin-like protein AAED1ic n=1 Tax=Rhizophora mucronata TaxID=61149 RepID=A0A2P2JE26_RHIMU
MRPQLQSWLSSNSTNNRRRWQVLRFPPLHLIDRVHLYN